MIPAAGAPGTAGSGFRVAREAADDVAGRLAEVLRDALATHHLVGSGSPFRMGGWSCSCGVGCGNGWEGYADHLAAAALLPVVEQIARQRAAEELEAAADGYTTSRDTWPIADDLRQRAAALRGDGR